MNDLPIWDQLLRRYVDQAGRVDYEAWSTHDPQTLCRWLAQQSADTNGREDHLAHWINLYNAFTIQSVLSAYPIASIRPTLMGLPNWIALLRFFQRRVHRLGNELFSLAQIENRMLRQITADPRIHFAIVCASVGCPLLRPRRCERGACAACSAVSSAGAGSCPRLPQLRPRSFVLGASASTAAAASATWPARGSAASDAKGSAAGGAAAGSAALAAAWRALRRLAAGSWPSCSAATAAAAVAVAAECPAAAAAELSSCCLTASQQAAQPGLSSLVLHLPAVSANVTKAGNQPTTGRIMQAAAWGMQHGKKDSPHPCLNATPVPKCTIHLLHTFRCRSAGSAAPPPPAGTAHTIPTSTQVSRN